MDTAGSEDRSKTQPQLLLDDPGVGQSVNVAFTRADRFRWLGSPTGRWCGKFDDLKKFVPEFDRRLFQTVSSDGSSVGANRMLDAIVRLPRSSGKPEIPVAVVSKAYALLQHRQVVTIIEDVLREAGIKPRGLDSELTLTLFGGRMALRVLIPGFQFDPGDGQSLGLRLECFNSVDGSSRFVAVVGWLRFVCSNGLIVGVTRSSLRRIHNRDLAIEEVREVFRSGLNQTGKDRALFKRWLKQSLTMPAIVPWIDKDVTEEWGVKAATRAWNILRTGRDAELLDPFKKNIATARQVKLSARVPGQPEMAANAYHVGQALSWLARQRADLQEQFDRTRQVPALVEKLIRRHSAKSQANLRAVVS